MKFKYIFNKAPLSDAVEHVRADIVHLLLTRHDIKVDLTSILNQYTFNIILTILLFYLV